MFQQQEGIPLNLGSRKLTNFQGTCNSKLAYHCTLLLCIVSLNVIYTRVSIHLGANTLETKFLFLSEHSFSQGLLTSHVSPSSPCSDNLQQTRFSPTSACFCLDNSMYRSNASITLTLLLDIFVWW